MTYPPGGTGYPPAQSPGSYGASTPSFAKSDDGESNLKLYLTIAVVALGFASYLASFGPMVTRMLPNGDEIVESGSSLPIDLALLAGVLAAVSICGASRRLCAFRACCWDSFPQWRAIERVKMSKNRPRVLPLLGDRATA